MNRRFLIVFIAAVFVTSFVFAQSATDEDLMWPVKYASESDATGDGGESLLLGVGIGNTTTECLNMPCWATFDDCFSDYLVYVGDLSGVYDASRSAVADAYFNSSNCGWGTEIGSLNNSYDLVVSVPHAWALDKTTSDGGDVEFYTEVKEYSNTDCTGTLNRISTDTSTCTTAYSSKEWVHAFSESKADCDGGYGDPTDCHKPDILISGPESTGYKSYWYKVEVSTCDSGGANCTSDYDTGCFVVYWY